jgi:flagellar biosynthetic protein FliR
MPTILQLLNLFLIFVRILAVLMTAPLFSNRAVPTIVKVGFAGILSIIILPMPLSSADAQLANLPTALLPFTLAVAQEILLGVVIGFVSNLVFVAVGIAANMMGLQAGFRAASLFNPFTNVSSSALDQFYTLVVIALFLALNGHHMLISTLVRTFDLVPPGTFVFGQVSFERLLFMFTQTFMAGVVLSLPVVGTLLLTDVGLGLIARAVPQIQVFFVGLPLKVGLGFLTLALTMAITLPTVKDMFADISQNILAISTP